MCDTRWSEGTIIVTTTDYIIFSDSSCDLPVETLREWGVQTCQLTVTFDGSDEVFQNDELPTSEFYRRMRAGEVAKTSAVNSDAFHKTFEKLLREGHDILYIAFSSGLSATYNSACIAMDELRPLYPERKMVAVDTLCASTGFGLILDLAVQQKRAGKSLDEVAQYVRDTLPHVAHWFTVDDLVYLKRGGRVDPKTAFVAGLLNIKPVLHVDDEGHLISMSKTRGRKNSLKALAEKYEETAETPDSGLVYISQADCYDDAKYLADLLVEKHSALKPTIVEIGPVIGSHSGPGTVALFFLASKR